MRCALKMLNQKLKLIIYISLLFCLFIAGCERVDTSGYNGDGEIFITGKYFISYGYKIEFAEIDFLKPFHKTFKISNYPKIGKTIVFGIATESSIENLKRLLLGDLSLKVTNSQNETIFDCSSNIGKWTFADRYDGEKRVYEYFIYSFHDHKSFVDIEKQSGVDPMFLTVNYEPNKTKVRLYGTLLLKAGGYK